MTLWRRWMTTKRRRKKRKSGETRSKIAHESLVFFLCFLFIFSNETLRCFVLGARSRCFTWFLSPRSTEQYLSFLLTLKVVLKILRMEHISINHITGLARLKFLGNGRNVNVFVWSRSNLQSTKNPNRDHLFCGLWCIKDREQISNVRLFLWTIWTEMAFAYIQ